MNDDNEILTGDELAEWMEQLANDRAADWSFANGEIEAHGWSRRRPSTRTPQEVRALLDRLQLLADNPQLRHRLGNARVSVELPFAD